MVPHRGVPAVVMHVSERHRRGSERSYDENGKSLFESVFHGNPGGSVRLVSVEKRDAKPEATATRRHFNAVNEAARLLNSRESTHFRLARAVHLKRRVTARLLRSLDADDFVYCRGGGYKAVTQRGRRAPKV
jgi:hypothetical protein